MTDDDPDVTPRTYADGEQHHSGAYRSLDPMQIELLRRLDRLDRVERTVDLIDRAVTGLTSSRRFWGWAAGIGVPALIGAAFTLLLWSADRVSTSSERVGRTEARIEGQAELIKLLQQEIVELRRRAGLDVHPDSDVLRQPDRFSLLDTPLQSMRTVGGGVVAAPVGDSGRVLRHSPKLQNLQSCCEPPHWMLLLQVEKQVLLGLTDLSRSSSGVGPGLAARTDDSGRAGDELQLAKNAATTSTVFLIPEM